MKPIELHWLLGPDISSRAVAWWGGSPANHWSHCASLLADGRYIDARDDRLAGVDPGVQFAILRARNGSGAGA